MFGALKVRFCAAGARSSKEKLELLNVSLKEASALLNIVEIPSFVGLLSASVCV
jgi:hypothetical protein